MGLPARRFVFTTCGMALLCLVGPAGAQQAPLTRTDTSTMKNVELAP